MTVPIDPPARGRDEIGGARGEPAGHSGSREASGKAGRVRRLSLRLLGGLALVGTLAVPWWGRAVLRHLAFFHVRAVQVEGTRYLDPSLVVQRLGVDTLESVWAELAPMEQRVRGLPLVRDVRLERKLPGTLVVHVEERIPVAFVPGAPGLEVRDVAGNILPIDPLRASLDVPVVMTPDSVVLRLLGELRSEEPDLFRRVSDVRVSGDEIRFHLYSTLVRARYDVNARRLADIRPVEADLARRNQRAAELDLRFRDQVIARLP